MSEIFWPEITVYVYELVVGFYHFALGYLGFEVYRIVSNNNSPFEHTFICSSEDVLCREVIEPLDVYVFKDTSFVVQVCMPTTTKDRLSRANVLSSVCARDEMVRLKLWIIEFTPVSSP